MAVNERDGFEDARIARLYAEAAREEPPAHLDRTIAAAARERAGRPAPARASPWWTPWRLPFAFAALAVVSVSLVTLMIEQDGERVTSVPARVSPSQPPPAPEREAAKIAQPLPPPAREEAKVAKKADTQEREQARFAQQPAEAPASSAVAPEEARSRRAQRRDPPTEPKTLGEAAATSAPPVQLDRRDAPAADAGPRDLQRAPAPAAPPQAAQDGLAAAAPRGSGEVQAPRAEQRPAAGPAPFPAERPAQALPDQAPAAKAASAPAEKPAPSPKPSIGIRGLQSEGYVPPARPSPEVARHLVELEGKPPSAWVERMLMLRRDRRTAEMDGLLAEFRRRYPTEPLPAELQ